MAGTENTPQQPTSQTAGEKPGMSTKKKWIIGCSGCLVVLVIAVVAIVALSGTLISNLKQASDQSMHAIFGDYQPPAGYMAIGMPAGQKDVKNMVLLMNTLQGRVIVALDTVTSPAEARVLQSGDTAQIEAYVKELSQKADTGDSKVGMEDIRLEETQTAQLPNGKTFPMIHAVMKASRRQDTHYSPAVITLLPTGENRMVVLLALDAKTESSSPQASFDVEQQALGEELTQIIQNSELDERLSG